MGKPIKDIVEQVIEQIREYGLTEATIQMYRDYYFKQIIRLHQEKNVETYSAEILDEYVHSALKQFNIGQKSHRYYNGVKRAVRIINSYCETGTVNFSKIIDTKKFKPTKEHFELIKKILDSTDLKEGYRYRIDVCIRKLFCYLEINKVDVLHLTAEDIIKYIINIKNENAGSMGYVIYAINLLCNYLHREYGTKVNARFNVFTPQTSPVRLIPPYTQEEINKILKAINANSRYAMRERAIVLLAFYTGLRGIDVIRLKIEDIFWEKSEIHIIQSKTHVPLTLPLNGMVMNAVADYILYERPKCEINEIFVKKTAPISRLKGTSSLDEMLDKLCKKAGVEKKPGRAFHSLRRSLAVEMSAAEVPVTTVSQILGHLSRESDAPYLSFNRIQTSFCAMGFKKIPLTKGIYACKKGCADDEFQR